MFASEPEEDRPCDIPAPPPEPPWLDSFEAVDTTAGTQIFRKRRPRDDDDEDDRRFARDGDRVVVPALLMDSASRAGDPPELHRPGYRTGPGSAPQRSAAAAPPRQRTFWCRDRAALEAHEQRGRELADAWRDPGTHWGQDQGLLGPLTDQQLDRLVGAVTPTLSTASSAGQPFDRRLDPRPAGQLTPEESRRQLEILASYPAASGAPRTAEAGEALLERTLRERDERQRSAWREGPR